jgi:AraC-like DNA-binding protein
MGALPHPPSLASHTADHGLVSLGKNGQAIPKLGGAAPMPSSLDFSGNPLNANNRNGTNGAESVRIWKARNYIHEHSGEELSLGQVAKAANTSANYFSEKFKEATGVNFVRYVAQVRYEKVAGLLRESDLRISEIAFATGFQSLSQFNRTFKKFAGKSPTKYRAAADCRGRNER